MALPVCQEIDFLQCLPSYHDKPQKGKLSLAKWQIG